MPRLVKPFVFWHRATQARVFLASLLLVFLSISQVSSLTQADDLYRLDFDPLYDLPLPPAWYDTEGFADTVDALLDQIANQTKTTVRVDLRLPVVDSYGFDEEQRAQWAEDQQATQQAILNSLPDGSYRRLTTRPVVNSINRVSNGSAEADTQAEDVVDHGISLLSDDPTTDPVGDSSLTLEVGEAALTALMVSNLVAKVQASAPETPLAGGLYHSLFIADDGSLWAWGENTYGQLGDGLNAAKNPSPKQILSGVAAVAGGHRHTLALKTDGSLWAWGNNQFGQLGDGTTKHSKTPKQILTGITAVASGGYHSLALKTDGSLWAWGYNFQGELGDGTTAEVNTTPKQILTGVAAVAAGDYHTLALKTDGTLWAWGENTYGQLGDGSTAEKNPSPKQILSGVTAVAGGHRHTLSLKTDGTLWAWGSNNFGQLGDGTTAPSYTPKQILSGFADVAAGGYYSLALKTDGNLWGWGSNAFGQLGDGSIAEKNTSPKQILSGVAAVAAGSYHALTRKTDGSLWGWGRNNYGQVGDETISENQLSPVELMDNINTVTITATDDLATEAGPTTGTFTFTRSGSIAAPLTVNFSIGGTATSGSDYQSLGSNVTFAAGSSTAFITVTPLQDSLVEAEETVILTLATGSGHIVGTPNSATVTLTSDQVTSYRVTATADTGGSISPADRMVNHGATTTFTVTPNSGYIINTVSGCGGSLSSRTYTTGAITAPCAVSATFNLIPPFNDVPASSWAYAYILAIRGAGITTGCDNNNYCPINLVARDQMAAFLIRAIEDDPQSNLCASGSPYNDVPSGVWYCSHVKRLVDRAITGGCGNGNYCPMNLVTREQMAAFIVRSVAGEPLQNYCGGVAPFKDVSPSSWSCGYIKKLVELGITQGCGNGNYCPGATVNREQMAAFLARAFLDMD